MKVGIVGAGVSGVVAGAHLKAAGIDVTVFERSDQAGGIWYGLFQRMPCLGRVLTDVHQGSTTSDCRQNRLIPRSDPLKRTSATVKSELQMASRFSNAGLLLQIT